MVNYSDRLDQVFGALVSPARRAILQRLARTDCASISELAQPISMSLPAVMKHLDVLEQARLITRAKTGRTMLVRLSPKPMAEAMAWLRRYEQFWSGSLDRLVAYAEKKEAQARRSPAKRGR
ncbi:MAG: metalloregulator ArsR/SmtB family transcription factor [Burkholderiaceae bacterium]